MSSKSNRYLLVIMDYFTKWAEAVPLPDQKVTSISKATIKLCSSFGIPDVIHSDQGRNFESCLFREMLTAFGIEKSRTTAYHPQGDGMVTFQPVTPTATSLLYTTRQGLGAILTTGAIRILYSPTFINRYLPLRTCVWQTTQVYTTAATN